MKNIGGVDNLGGFDDLKEEDQVRSVLQEFGGKGPKMACQHCTLFMFARSMRWLLERFNQSSLFRKAARYAGGRTAKKGWRTEPAHSRLTHGSTTAATIKGLA